MTHKHNWEIVQYSAVGPIVEIREVCTVCMKWRVRKRKRLK